MEEACLTRGLVWKASDVAEEMELQALNKIYRFSDDPQWVGRALDKSLNWFDWRAL